MDVEAIAREVLSALKETPPSTVVVVHEDGGIAVQEPGRSDFAGADRRRRPVATFIASQQEPPVSEVAARIRQGLYKSGLDHDPVAIR